MTTNPINAAEISRIISDSCQDTTLVLGRRIQHDKSGVGHCWRGIDRDDIPASTVEEIEAEILDGGRDTCDLYVASGGGRYRW